MHLSKALRIPAILSILIAMPTLTLAAVSRPVAEKVRARQAFYRELGTAFKAVNDELKKDAPVRVSLGYAVDQLVSLSAQQASFFPAGTGMASGAKTGAKEEIWSKPKDFKAAQDRLRADAIKLRTLFKAGDMNGFRAQAKQVGADCKSCHTAFREEI